MRASFPARHVPDATPLLQDYLHASAAGRPDHVALVCEGQRLTFAELEARSNALAHGLVRQGVRRGDRVVVFADNSVLTVVAFWAILKANAVLCVVNPATRADKLAGMLLDCRASALVSDLKHAATFAEAVPRTPHLRTVIVSGELAAEQAGHLPGFATWNDALAAGREDAPPARLNIDSDLAAVIYSSASTGEPKAVMLTHRNMLAVSASMVAYFGHQADDVTLSVLPLSLSYGTYQMVVAYAVGARLVLERSFAFPAQILKLMETERVTSFAGVPMIWATVIGLKNLDHYDLSSLRTITNAAAALPVPHLLRVHELLPHARFFSMYGQTECARIAYLPPEDIERKPGSIGVPIPNTEFWVEDEHGQRLGPGQVGELVVRGAHVMRGYWERPELTAARLRPGPLPGEWVLHTGDLHRIDEEGYLYFVSRMDDIIKSRGEKVSPREVENAIAAIPGVREVAVIGVPDEILGQAVKAFLLMEPEVVLTEKAVRLECEKRLEPFMVPKHVVFVTSLPRTSGGKIKKSELK